MKQNSIGDNVDLLNYLDAKTKTHLNHARAFAMGVASNNGYTQEIVNLLEEVIKDVDALGRIAKECCARVAELESRLEEAETEEDRDGTEGTGQ